MQESLNEALSITSSLSSAVSKPMSSKHLNHRTPVMSDWYTTRVNLKSTFSVDPATLLCPFAAPLGSTPMQSQERSLINDILALMMGIEGDYIVPDLANDAYDTRTFSISDSIESSLRELVKDILPIASHYSIVSHFTHEYKQFAYGKVNHALVAAMKHMLHEYSILVCKLEKILLDNKLNLQSLWYYIQPSLVSMRVMADIAIKIHQTKSTGGRVLSLLHKMIAENSGDAELQQQCLFLLEMAAVPYMKILQAWVHSGVIRDEYQEFLVEDNEGKMAVTSKDFWEKRYTIRQAQVPVFLERVAGLVLRTGKYLNVIQQCRVTVKSSEAGDIVYSVSERPYVEAIESAYTFASQTLLELILKDYDLIGRLKSMKHYFLLDQGDFIVQFMDSCEHELQKKIGDVVPQRIETLLELALRTSAANGDPYKDCMRTALMPNTIYQQLFSILNVVPQEQPGDWQLCTEKLDGYKAFVFDYQVEWPVSLVLNREAIEHYQKIFRTLFYCKHVERTLCKAWIMDKSFKTLNRGTGSKYAPAFTLRQRMLNAIQNLEYYMMAEVLEPNWQTFLHKLSKVKYIDDVLEAHRDFLSTVMNDCMMSSIQLLTAVNTLMASCMAFCQFAQSDLNDGDGGDGLNYDDSIVGFDQHFTSVLVGLINKISERGRESNNEKLITLLYRLDFNNYYSMKMNKMTELPVKSETSG